MRRWQQGFLATILFVLTMAACSAEPATPSQPDPTTPPVGEETAALPTPTLAAGVTAPPTAEPTATNSNSAEAQPTTDPSAILQDDSGRQLPDGSVTLDAEPLPPVASLTPSEQLAAGDLAFHNGDFAQAAAHYQAVVDSQVSGQLQIDALYGLGRAYLRDDRPGDAATILNQLIQLGGDGVPSATHYHLAQALYALGNSAEALAALDAYLAANPDMAAYVYGDRGDWLAASGDTDGALAAYQQAVSAETAKLHEIGMRQTMADLYRAAGDLDSAVVQYDAIRDRAVTEATKGAMNFLAGAALIEAGNTQAGHERYLFGVNNYPRAYESYAGLIELVEAGVPVDEYQRGLVDLYAEAYEPAAEAFERYLAANPTEYRPDAPLYLAQSYRALGNLDAALAALDTYALTNPAEAQIERARTYGWLNQPLAAIAEYDRYLELYPDGDQAPFAMWWGAALTEQIGETAGAIQRYTRLADTFPDHDDAPEALFRAGWLAQNSGDPTTAETLWQRAATSYPTSEFGAEAMVWLMRTLPADDPALGAIPQLAQTSNATHYFALRAKDLAMDVAPFSAETSFQLPTPAEDAAALAETEAWLREMLALEPDTPVSELSPELANDPRFVRGSKLWELGRYQDAARELGALLESTYGDALGTFQLALAYRDLGLYRYSIAAANSTLQQSGETVFTAPKFLGRLIYPTYYSDLVLAEANRHGYDPRLQLALMRQESLFESFATSSAVAQGLSQVIPDTGAYIAQQLQWPENYENADLYKPYVGVVFGAHYLSTQLEAFDGDVHAALAAYNAGPGNAIRWYETAGSDLDQYVETVDFNETRLYIERIYSGFNIYRHLYAD